MKVYKFRIELNGIRPLIWRQIQVPEDYTFWELHVALQDAMGWRHMELHQFDVSNLRTGESESIGLPYVDMDWEAKASAGWDFYIADYFRPESLPAVYTYDFGYRWTHSITLETISPTVPGVKYPCCLRGERACPPEEIGGVDGYYDFVMVMGNPDHDDHREIREWYGRKYYPEKFSPEKVKFSDPRRRLKQLLAKQ